MENTSQAALLLGAASLFAIAAFFVAKAIIGHIMAEWIIKKVKVRSARETPKAPGMVSVNLQTGETKPVSETDGGKLWAKIASGECPDCDSREGFFEGPSGGMSTNIKCANEACGSRFNVTPIVGTAERLGK
jgi:hypothetical protein